MKLLLLLAAAAPVFAQCSFSAYTFTPAVGQISIPATASTTPNTISIAAAAECAWTYSTSTPWLTLQGPANNFGTGNGTISFVATQNIGPGGRTGSITVATDNGGQAVFTIVQVAPTCTLTLDPTSVSVALAGGTGSFQVQTNCTWIAASQSNFVGLTTLPEGSLNGTVNYSVNANACVPALTGTIAVQAGGPSGLIETFQVDQAGSQSNLTLTPTSLNAPNTATIGTVAVATGSGCSWGAYSDVSWMSLSGSTSGAGSGQLSYSILANTSAVRTGSIHAGATLFTVTQAAVTAPAVTLAAVGNGADYALGPVSPGEVVVLAGSNLGPSIGVKYTVANGFLPTILGGVQVYFGNIAAPLLYVSATQVNAVVPFEVSGSTQATVSYGGAVSNAISLQVAPTTPGILTLDASGFGGGAILNQDLSVNTPGNAAELGSAVVIYCIGGGVTNPASADGQVFGNTAPALAASPVTVTIGGLNAQVFYSGFVAGSIAGLTQINAYVPSGLTTGGQLPIVVSIGGVQSQANVTVAIQ